MTALALGWGTARAHAPVGPSAGAGPGDGAGSPGLAATAVGVGPADLVVGVARSGRLLRTPGAGQGSGGSGVAGQSSSRAPSTAACSENRWSGRETLYPVS